MTTNELCFHRSCPGPGARRLAPAWHRGRARYRLGAIGRGASGSRRRPRPSGPCGSTTAAKSRSMAGPGLRAGERSISTSPPTTRSRFHRHLRRRARRLAVPQQRRRRIGARRARPDRAPGQRHPLSPLRAPRPGLFRLPGRLAEPPARQPRARRASSFWATPAGSDRSRSRPRRSKGSSPAPAAAGGEAGSSSRTSARGGRRATSRLGRDEPGSGLVGYPLHITATISALTARCCDRVGTGISAGVGR